MRINPNTKTDPNSIAQVPFLRLEVIFRISFHFEKTLVLLEISFVICAKEKKLPLQDSFIRGHVLKLESSWRSKRSFHSYDIVVERLHFDSLSQNAKGQTRSEIQNTRSKRLTCFFLISPEVKEKGKLYNDF